MKTPEDLTDQEAQQVVAEIAARWTGAAAVEAAQMWLQQVQVTPIASQSITLQPKVEQVEAVLPSRGRSVTFQKDLEGRDTATIRDA